MAQTVCTWSRACCWVPRSADGSDGDARIACRHRAMNFLAHAILAGPADDDLVGGIAGDFVKGGLTPLPAGMTQAFADGVMLHRRIDSFADAHPAFRRSRARVSAARRRVSGIMVDLFYDHFLARHWARFCAQGLEAFTAHAYARIRSYPAPLPPAFAPVFAHMEKDDWLSSYGDAQAIVRALDRMAQFRFRRANPLAGGGAELLLDYAGFEADFLAFLPDALEFAAAVRAARTSG